MGKATSLSQRVAQYYATPLGARRPHAGGHFLKTLSNLDQLHVHDAVSPDPPRSEHLMLEAFCAAVSTDTRNALHDPEHPFPFANLEWPAGTRKRHGVTGGREPRLPLRRPNRPTEKAKGDGEVDAEIEAPRLEMMAGVSRRRDDTNWDATSDPTRCT